MEKKWALFTFAGSGDDVLVNVNNVTHAYDNEDGKLTIWLTNGKRICTDHTLGDFVKLLGEVSEEEPRRETNYFEENQAQWR